jgi:hypothetical protein
MSSPGLFLRSTGASQARAACDRTFDCTLIAFRRHRERCCRPLRGLTVIALRTQGSRTRPGLHAVARCAGLRVARCAGLRVARCAGLRVDRCAGYGLIAARAYGLIALPYLLQNP